METTPAKHILIAPLDWGLGHTTRCIPIIRYLLQQGHKVTVAGNEVQQKLLRDACPTVSLTYVNGYNVGYSKNKHGFMLSLLGQLPRLLRAINTEYKWLIHFIGEHKVDGIISDNRYGLHHPKISSVIMTHQLEVQTGLGKLFDQLLRPLHYRFLKRFNECWVVDRKEQPSLAGSLSHPEILPGNEQYIGWLSQLQQVVSKENDYLLILLSGPEPQRTILSQLLWAQALHYSGKIVFVEGAPQVHEVADIPAHIEYHGRLSTQDLQPLLVNAQLVICRSGYSTLMDLVLLGKKAILIPTPGQTEQEYLAEMLHKQGLYYSIDQRDFQLEKDVQKAATCIYQQILTDDAYTAFIPVLNNWLQRL